MTSVYLNGKAERLAYEKKYEAYYLSQLNNEYSDFMLTGDLTRVQWALPKIEKLMQAVTRGVIKKTDYNKRRATIEKFIFNK